MSVPMILGVDDIRREATLFGACQESFEPTE
jgi:hypothetical protein